MLGSLGLAEPIFKLNVATPAEVLSYRTDTGPLITSGVLSRISKHFGYPFAGVKRSVFLQYGRSPALLHLTYNSLPRYLLDSVKARGIDLRFGHSLASLVQDEDFVTAIFENGHTVKGSFVVGCDGLHSRTRIALFGDEVAEYTGLAQVHYQFCFTIIHPRS